MLSRGGKVEWHCPFCDTTDIKLARRDMLGRNIGLCGNKECNSWWPWSMRIKRSINKKVQHGTEKS